MSNDRAIATVTGVLQSRITSVLAHNGMGGFASSITAPSDGDSPGVYLHLFRVVPDVSLQPTSFPTRRSDGSVVQRPQLALNLHYQVSFVTSDDNGDFGAERLAGLVLAEFHARPLLSSGEIGDFIDNAGDAHPLNGSDLHQQEHGVRVSMLAMDLEDQSRLWGMLNQSFHALTVGLEVSAVLIDDVVSPVVALPVVRPALSVVPGAAPVLEAAVSSARRQPIVQLYPAGSMDTESLVLRGRGLVGPQTLVRIGELELMPTLHQLADGEILIPLDDASGVRPGVFGVQVAHRVDIDTDPMSEMWRDAGSSGTIAIALVPTLSPGGVAADGSDRLVTVALVPSPSADESMTLLLDGTAGEGHFRGTVEPGSVAGSNVEFRVPGLATGTYRMRVIVAGATSVLAQDASGFTGPEVVVP